MARRRDGFYWIENTAWKDSRAGKPVVVAELTGDGWFFPGYGGSYTGRDDRDIKVLAGPLQPPFVPRKKPVGRKATGRRVVRVKKSIPYVKTEGYRPTWGCGYPGCHNPDCVGGLAHYND